MSRSVQMQPVLVDTDVVSYLMVPGTANAERFRPFLEGRIPTISFITVAELYSGAHMGGWGERRMAKLEQTIRRYALLPWDDNLAKLWGQLRARAKQRGSPLWQHTNDLWIATCAIYYDAPLLTNNRRHMSDLPELKFADDE